MDVASREISLSRAGNQKVDEEGLLGLLSGTTGPDTSWSAVKSRQIRPFSDPPTAGLEAGFGKLIQRAPGIAEWLRAVAQDAQRAGLNPRSTPSQLLNLSDAQLPMETGADKIILGFPWDSTSCPALGTYQAWQTQTLPSKYELPQNYTRICFTLIFFVAVVFKSLIQFINEEIREDIARIS